MKMLIANIHMKPGGNRRSLLNLLSNIDLENNEVDLFLFAHKGNVREDIGQIKGIRLLDESFLLNMFYTPLKTYCDKKGILKKVLKKVISFLTRVIGTRKMFMFLMLFQKRLGYYDVAISFAHDKWVGGFYGGCNDFVKKKVSAKRKVAWIHNDPYKLGFTKDICENTYEEFDCIVNVSNACKEKFDEIIPKYKGKSIVVYNMFNAGEIRKMAEEYNPYDYDGFKIVTVARMFNLQKRIDRIIECCRRLKNDGIEGFRWYVVGDGPDKSWLKEKTDSESLQDIVIFEGHKDNPYPYMRHADVFVLTSSYEAQGMVVIESLITGTPVIVTDYEEAFEFVNNKLNGIITVNSTDGVYEAVKDILLHKEKLLPLRKYITKQDFDNILAVEQFWNAVKGK
ncbi:MAG TPA: glycosyltransferase [Clostridiaceae bacterium]